MNMEHDADFIARHIGPRPGEQGRMLEFLGVSSLEELISQVVPDAIRAQDPLDLPPPLSEREALQKLEEISEKNVLSTSLIGMGYYGTITPKVILRNVLENPGWYTAYTPYQAEVSQGRLEALLNFQEVVRDLTGLPVANASLLDEGTAAAEAMLLAYRACKTGKAAFFVDRDTHPQTISVLRTRADVFGFEVRVGEVGENWPAGDFFGALFSYPGSSGVVRDFRPSIDALKKAGGLSIFATDLLALTMLVSPGELGADVAIGSAQRFGVPMGYGGPHAAFMAVQDAHRRLVPGRIIGVSKDRSGRVGLRMAMQTREQHIRREKATSNICTAQVLLAIMASMYAVYHGPLGVLAIAKRCHRWAVLAARSLEKNGYTVVQGGFFDTVTVSAPGTAREIFVRAQEKGFNLRLVDDDHLAFSCDETMDLGMFEGLMACFHGGGGEPAALFDEEQRIPPALRRTSSFLTHPVFSKYHSETEMLRYLRQLQSKDIALDRAMIPLGSCTMKLNATTEMIPVTWPRFCDLHPFVPRFQALGYRELFSDLEAWLGALTGFDAVSLQPNAGSQGEYAGLLAIRAYHRSRGEEYRDICLIPASAHGTNPASAVMAGMKVVVVACDENGNVDLTDLEEKSTAHRDTLAALMVTYPSTHGVFEEGIGRMCAMVHACGGQVYLDGANLNALVGLVRPGDIGADVCHMNLHKTFCIPHGGGGPGVGPIGVKAHLAPFLPDHGLISPLREEGGGEGDRQICAAPWGSASILPISWAYIAMMGAEGLTRASCVAILNANYIASRLHNAYPVVYTGPSGRVAHECILDLRGIKERTGITAEDVAKRLIDYGFHAPTMSWPVAETLMVEPTESESLCELDRFCETMLKIRAEIAEIEAGRADRLHNVLKMAPHTAQELVGPWPHPYSRREAVFPLASLERDKYWPPVDRVDNVHGDRHFVCACPPLSAYGGDEVS